MARWENENVSGLDLPSPDSVQYSYFGSGAEEVNENSAFAKRADNNGYKTYYIKFGRGDLFDPLGADTGKHTRPYFDFKKVSEPVFEYYMQYLTTEDIIFLTRARRSLMERN